MRLSEAVPGPFAVAAGYALSGLGLGNTSRRSSAGTVSGRLLPRFLSRRAGRSMKCHDASANAVVTIAASSIETQKPANPKRWAITIC